jgi:hypothetical protein
VDGWRRLGPVLWELCVVEQRYNAVIEVLRDGCAQHRHPPD